MLARDRAEREEPLLDRVEFARVAVEAGQEALHLLRRLAELGQHPPQSVQRRIEAAFRLGRGGFEPAQRLHQRPLGAVRPQRRGGAGDVVADALRGAELAAAGVEGGLLVRLRIEPVEFGHRMLEERAVASAGLQRHARGLQRGCRGGAGRPGGANRAGIGAGEGVEEPAVAARVEEAAVVLLAVQLDQRVGQRPQRLGRHAPVVGPGLAPAVRADGAAQDQLGVRRGPRPPPARRGRRGRAEARRRR